MRKAQQILGYLALVVMLILTLTACGKGSSADALEFVSNGDGTCSVSGKAGSNRKTIDIPAESPDGDRVTSIAEDAFIYCNKIKTITIPEGVTSIGENAFYKCSGLTSISIPDSITSIDNNVFIGCDSLVYNEYQNGKYLGNSTNPYDGLETRARRLGFKLLADLVRHKEREQEDREDYDR